MVVGMILVALGVMAPSVQSLALGYELGLPEGLLGLRLTQGIGYGLGGLALVMAFRGFVALLMDPSERYLPYAEALNPLAAEHGRDVEIHGKNGLGFVSLSEGPRVEILVQPFAPGTCTIWMDSPGRQRLLFMPMRDDTQADDPDWRRVGSRDGWVLRAGLPSAARGYLEEGALAADLSQLLSLPQVRAIRHDYTGLEIISELLPPQDLQLFVHAGLNVGRRLRRLNAPLPDRFNN
jgi:hypothetical protein